MYVRREKVSGSLFYISAGTDELFVAPVLEKNADWPDRVKVSEHMPQLLFPY